MRPLRPPCSNALTGSAEGPALPRQAAFFFVFGPFVSVFLRKVGVVEAGSRASARGHSLPHILFFTLTYNDGFEPKVMSPALWVREVVSMRERHRKLYS